MTRDAPDPLGAVEAAEAAVRPALAERLRSAVAADDAVAGRLREWAPGPGLDAGVEGEAAVERAVARQASVLTNHVRYRVVVGDRPPDGLGTTPVSPFVDLELPDGVESALDDLASTLDEMPGTDPDLLGTRYAEALSAEERRSRGQFYTPPAVAGWLTRWALDGDEAGDVDGQSRSGDDPPRVLDPAAGTGTFPLAAFDRLRERAPEADLDDLLSRIVAVDVDDVALHLAGLRLSARAGGRPVGAFDRRVRSFFDLEPAAEGSKRGDDRIVAPVDAVVGNPPFVRAGDLSPGRDHFRDHLEAFGPAGGGASVDGASPYADGEAVLSRRSDAYVYFVTHATRFLRPGGRLGLVLPAKWLESDYGAGFRRFLVDQYRVRAVVGFDARAFDALVDTVLLLAERRARPGVDDDAASRVNFLRLEEPLDASASLSDLLADPADENADGGNGTGVPEPRPRNVRDGVRARVIRRSPSTFATAEKCSPYLRAPGPLLSLLDHPSFVQLGDLARVSRGVTTGANAFFLLDAADRERLGVDDDLLRPAVRSIRGVDSRTVTPADVDRWMVDVHGVLSSRPDGNAGDREGPGAGDDAATRAKAALRAAGHDAFVDYVEDAESAGRHEGRTCRARRVWFDLGDLPTPDAFVPKLLRERVFTVRNEAGAVPTNAIDCVSVREGVEPAVLLGVLDSSLSRALMELWGRNEAGMLQLMTYETRTLPIPDVRTFSAEEAAAIRTAAADLEATGDGQAALDSAVHAALDVDLSAERARAMRERLLARRIDGGDRVEAPVS